MNKTTKLYHSVSENGNIQVRLVTEYLKDGKVKGREYGGPVTPADPRDMTGWDIKSQGIVAAILDETVLADFKVEQQATGTDIVGAGIEEAVTYDRVIDDLCRISIRRITRIFDEGVEVSKKYHRSWIMPGDDPNGADVISKALALKLHTPEVIELYKKRMAELETNRI